MNAPRLGLGASFFLLNKHPLLFITQQGIVFNGY